MEKERNSSYRELRVWRKAMDLAESCYLLTRGFPADERFGLTSQIRRAAGAIPANIAEGYGRGHRPDYVRFLWTAQGSLKELETHLLLSQRVGIVDTAAIDPVMDGCDEVGKMLGSLIRSLRPNVLSPTP